jgi:hypothetical protein
VKICITRAGVKTVARFVVARAVSTSISLIIHKNSDPESRLEQASVHVGAFVIGEWAGDAIKPYVNSQIDEAADFIAQIRKMPTLETSES